jgi:signal transduction histidine kinase
VAAAGAVRDAVRQALRLRPTGAQLQWLTGAQLQWLLRLLELPAVLLLVRWLTRGIESPTAAGALALTCAAWVGWLYLSHWKVRGRAADRAVWPTLLVIAVASGFASRDTGGGTVVALAVIVALHAGTTLRPWMVVTVTSAGVVGVLAGRLALGSDWRSAITDSLVIAGGATCGAARGLRTQQLSQSTLLLAQQEETQEAREHAATLAERGRIARDIHDVLAHSLADLSIHLEVADALLSDSGDGSGALRHVRRAHRISADGLEEVRRVVHALRADTPTLPDALVAMTGAYREEGTEARFDLLGPPRPLPSAVGLALLRTAREAMANARKHAAGRPVTVVLRFDDDRVALTVADQDRRGDQNEWGERERGGRDRGTGPGKRGDRGVAGGGNAPDAAEDALPPARPRPVPDGVGGGYGLAGMHERLRLVGGSLTAGPSLGGWRVHAEVRA